tara:strand:- start:79 stop:279 length:201 start_codon:yes stop_codon:yes gene_type:complete
MIKTSKVKKVFNSNGIQITSESIEMIKDDFNRKVSSMVTKCRQGNVKRLTPETYHIALGNLRDYLQ